MILFVGSGFERKGVPALLHALASMRHADAMLLVVGQDKRLVRMQALAAKLRLAHRVRFLGGRQDLRPFLGTADLFCLPTLYDPMPNAALEALACGLPVVTTATCGAAELIRPGETGLICDALDRAALADCLDRLSGPARPDPAAVRASVEHLSLATMAQELSSLYANLCATGALAK